MPVRNVHERRIPAPAEEVGRLLDTLTAHDDLLWPHEHWPCMTMRPRLEAGARGGHGPVRYSIEQYEPGRRVVFRFHAPRGFDGTHGFEVEPEGDGAILRQILEMRLHGPAWITWPCFFRPLHDALIEDALDKAHVRFGGMRQASWSWYVRFLRALLRPSGR